eukprot:m.150259 g.150259  ORF g.150259 m.150259 type:complete len:152 (+) comp15024_c0_seq2:427-882(+)
MILKLNNMIWKITIICVLGLCSVFAKHHGRTRSWCHETCGKEGTEYEGLSRCCCDELVCNPDSVMHCCRDLTAILMDWLIGSCLLFVVVLAYIFHRAIYASCKRLVGILSFGRFGDRSAHVPSMKAAARDRENPRKRQVPFVLWFYFAVPN